MKKYNCTHIGELHITNEGYTAKVIEGGSREAYCIIQIKNWTKEVRYSALKKKTIKYPYHKSVSGTGYFGVGVYSATKHKEAISIWRNLINRCYSEVHLQRNPTYRGTTVCKEWHNFQNFAKWFYEESNYQEGWEIDKDLLQQEGGKVYSAITCIFLPHDINSFLTNTQVANTSGFIGVHYKKSAKDKPWAAQINISRKRTHLGYFKTPEQASTAYKKAREIQALQLQAKYKESLPAEILTYIA